MVAIVASIPGPDLDGRALTWLGLAVALAGLLLVRWAYRTMGSSFTPFPTPPESSSLVVRGPYRYLRHPMYVGGTLTLLGISLAFSAIGVALTGLLALLWFFKARREERLLAQRFPDYGEYRRGTLF